MTSKAIILIVTAALLSSCGGDEPKSSKRATVSRPAMSPGKARALWMSSSGTRLQRGARRHAVATAIGRRQLLVNPTRQAVVGVLGDPDHVSHRGGKTTYGYQVGVYRTRRGGCTEVLDLTFSKNAAARPDLTARCVDDVVIEP